MNKLRMKLLVTALLTLPFFGIRAYEWAPVGDAVEGEVTSYATESGTYSSGDVIKADEGLDSNGSFAAVSGETEADNTVDIYGTIDQTEDGEQCPLKIDGDVTLSAVEADLTVNIKTPVTIEPYMTSVAPDGASEAEGEGAMVIFETVAGKKITVNVDYDLTFRGITNALRSRKTRIGYDYADMHVVFKGAGQTVFKMADGTSLVFDGQIDESKPRSIDDQTGLIELGDGDYSANAGGTKVFVLMDQTAEQVNAGQNKLVIERKNNGDASLRTMIKTGPNSVFTYLSNNYQGLVEPDGDGIATDGKYYAAVAIDVSNTKSPTVAAPKQGTGRMVWYIAGADKKGWQTGDYTGGENADPMFLKMVAKYPFNDGALVIAGHAFVPTDSEAPFDNYADFRTAYDATVDDSTGYNFSAPAGVKAIFRVVDNNAYAAAAAATGFTSYAPTAAQRRGLLLINDCQNIGKYFSDPYWDFYGIGSTLGGDWSPLNPVNAGKNVRMGCVLGVNGVLDVYDGAFVDYVGGASNEVDPLAANDFDGSYLKKRNPSAFIVDGMDVSQYADPDNEHPFVGANPSPTYAEYPEAVLAPQIILRGNAKMMFKNAAFSSDPYTTEGDASTGLGTGYMRNFWARDPLAPEEDDPIADPAIDFNMTLVVGDFVDGVLQKAGYDGYQLAQLTNADGLPLTKTGEGEHVLDVEGNLVVTTVSNNTITGRTNTEASERTGIITLSSVLTDYAGREINVTEQTDQQTYSTEVIARPLLYSDAHTYARYNSPGLFINGKMSLYNTTYAHTDATKLVTTKPEESEPAITGGERLFFASEQYATDQASDPDRYRYPELRLFNSELALHETMCLSGLRLVVMDDPGHPYNAPDAPDYSGSNLSIIRFYDHGSDLDALNTEYGRLLMLGSSQNLFEDAIPATNYVAQSAFINVFKHNKPKGLSGSTDVSSTVKLSLRNGNEYPADFSATQKRNQRAPHYIWSGMPPVGTHYAHCGVFVGWPTVGDIDDSGVNFPVADSRSYPYPGEEFSTEDKATYWFKLDARTAADDARSGFTANSDYWKELPSLPAAPAELAIEGDSIGFSAGDDNGNGALVPVKDANDRGNVNVDFGGVVKTSQTAVDARATSSLFTAPIGTNVVFRVWNDYDYDGVNLVTKYGGLVDLPAEQVTFANNYGIQPVGLTADMIDSYPESAKSLRLPVGEEMVLAWFYRDPRIGQFAKSRTAITRPEYLFYVGSDSDVKQFRVSGATANDPLYMDISGDGYRAGKVARVREFATQYSMRTQKFIGEGDHGIIFAEYGGRFGLGSTEWNANSLHAWSILGEDYITIAPLGDCTVDVNEDIIVADDLPFMPTAAFGGSAVNRMTIRSETEKEIRVVRGTVLDLSGFGQSAYRQEIAFGGKIKLVIEEGGGIRFPTPGTAAEEAAKGGVVLYFNDQSQLVFEGVNEAVPARYFSAAATDANRIKIFGKGQIWLNKSAKLNVMGTASVAVQADATTPTTDFTISLQRQSQFNIGDVNLSGGVFQVGNTAPVSGTNISFGLAINGADATFHTDREGFFGLGAGIINKISSKPNGNATVTGNPQLTNNKATIVDDLPVFTPDGTGETQEDGSEFTEGNAWQVIPLSNVKDITITLQNGIIEHKNIFNGADSNASLWAVGPFSGTGTFKLNGGASAIVRGGGNMMLVPSTLPEGYSFIPVNVWDYAGTLADTGEQYGILASSPLMLQRPDITTGRTNYGLGGFSFVNTTPADFYNLLAYSDYSAQDGKRFVTVGLTQFETSAAFVNKDVQNVKYPAGVLRIVRLSTPNAVNGKVADALKIGALSAKSEGPTDPTIFAVIE